MCRLFGMSGGPRRVRATFWLLEAPDSLAQQSRREPDGTGVGCFDEHGHPLVHKQALAAYEDQDFAQEARELSSRTFIAHIRYASTGAIAPQNTHPFQQRDRLFAHNGVIEDLPALERELGEQMSLVRGQTDSERYFALITGEIERTGDVGKGIVSAVDWVAQNLPVFAMNFILITATDVWALRYPDVHELCVLERGAGGTSGRRHLEQASARGMRVRSGELAHMPCVVIASERMDEDAGWRPLQPGELLHVDGDLKISSTTPFDRPPANQLSLEDLSGKAASSQTEKRMATV
ncbi:MAG TPA: class II glutamine amidotransferase [Solirubrobacteraceae bacterium]|jgi:glutamine amidotransferase|nr:class II glutamine amidotransferase [Solirubrobacteraceae bacterium]